MARDYAQTAKELVAALGGNENINNVIHCATRLRFILSDHKVVNKEKVSKDIKLEVEEENYSDSIIEEYNKGLERCNEFYDEE